MIGKVTTKAAIGLMERGWLPDAAIRAGIRRLLKKRLDEESALRVSGEGRPELAEEVRTGPVAPVPEKANEQHYEIPAEFFQTVLGPHLKYSSCIWTPGMEDLGEAEAHALETTVERAGLEDGMDVLELGCGWGSLTLFMAERFPGSRITAVSNSAPQRRFILDRARERGLENLTVITADMNEFEAPGTYDRVVSVEMFEHMRNYRELFRRISSWLKPGGRLFVHIFCHRRFAYPFQTEGESDWMGRHFFTGGIMPSRDLLPEMAEEFDTIEIHDVDGKDYQKTSEAWLSNMDANRKEILGLFTRVYGKKDAARWFRRWRIFFMACAELFGYRDGTEWHVAHYVFENAPRRAPVAKVK
jgi:cyclopropane-fatty-acyl-phospholipid synthase